MSESELTDIGTEYDGDDYLNALWVPRDDVLPNDWNPNEMERETRDQLHQSILDNGWTRPLLIHREELYIIDGEQRWHVAGRPDVRGDIRLTPPDVPAGYVPVYAITVSESQAKLGTVQHNQATGTQEPDRLRDFIDKMDDRGLLETLNEKVGFDPSDVDLTVVEDIPDEERDDDVFSEGDDRSTAAQQHSPTEIIEFAMTADEFDSVFTSTTGAADRIVSDVVELVASGELADVLDYTDAEAEAIEREVAHLLDADGDAISTDASFATASGADGSTD